MIVKTLFILALFCIRIVSTYADDKIGSVTNLPLPRFVILKSRDVNMRTGPGMNYSNKINYKCSMTPVRVHSEFENWRLIQDIDGNQGWIHEAMLDGRRYAQVNKSNILNSDEEVLIFRLPDLQSQPIARIEVGAIGKLIHCKGEWCQINFGKSYKGWILKNRLWGINVND